MQPRRHRSLCTTYTKLIGEIFNHFNSGDVVLGGGCALIEFFLGHRRTTDIDLFVSDPSIFREIQVLLQCKFGHIEKEKQGPNSYKFKVCVNQKTVPVHCIFLSKTSRMVQEKWTISFEDVFLHHYAFVDGWKINRKLGETNYRVMRDFVDVYYTELAGGDISLILDAFIDIGKELNPCPYEVEIPKDEETLNKISADIDLNDLEQFVESFTCRFGALYNQSTSGAKH